MIRPSGPWAARLVLLTAIAGSAAAGVAAVELADDSARPDRDGVVVDARPISSAAGMQERVRPPKRPPNRIKPGRPGNAPRRLPPNRVVPGRDAPQIDRPPVIESRRGPDGDAGAAGMTRLAARLGSARPTGAGVVVAMVEADEGQGRFMPDRGREEFDGVTFVGGRPGEPSAHATGTARRFFGDGPTAATGISRVHLFSAQSFLRDDGLLIGQPRLPVTLPGVRILANAWVGDAGEASNEARQRIDVMAARDGVLIVAGLPNSGPPKPLMAGGWNVLQVGTIDAGHSGARDRAGDGTGGDRPRITAPGGTTSAAVPVVAAAAAILMETADTMELGGLAEAERPVVRRLAGRPEVITAALLAGARRENVYGGRWSDGSELVAARAADPAGGAEAAEAAPRRRAPLDPAVGAGSLDVDVSHRILTGGPTGPGLAAPPESWSILSPAQAEGRWVIDIDQPTTLTATLVWYRMPVPGRGLVLGDLDLELLRVTDADPGRAERIAISDASESSVEGLHLTLEEPGRYVLRALDRRPDDRTGLAAIAWVLRAEGLAFIDDEASPRRRNP